MRMVGKRWVLLLSGGVIFAAAVACSSESAEPTQGPTPTPTATPITADTFGRAPTATPTPVPDQMKVVRLSDLDSRNDTVYEELLGRLPDNDITRSYVFLNDFAGSLEALGIQGFLPGTPIDEVAEIAPLLVQDHGGFIAGLPNWPYGMREYVTMTDWLPNVAFNFLSTEQSAYASYRFGNQPTGNTPNITYDVAFGQFDPAATADALAACECDQPDSRTRDGIEFYSWGEELIGQLRRRFEPPLYDFLGRGPRLLIRDGEAYWSIHDVAMEEMVDVLTSARPSLADDPMYTELVRLVAGYGHIREIELYGRDLAVSDQASAPWRDEAWRQAVNAAPLLHPFELVATAMGFDGETAFGIVALGHADPTVAGQNADLLLQRIRTIETSPGSGETWADRLEKIEIGTSGQFLVARLYEKDPNAHAFGFGIALSGTLVIHE